MAATRALALLSIVAVITAPRLALALCDVIPSAVELQRSDKGSVDRPYAAPGDYVGVSLVPLDCTRVDSFPAGPHVVTVLFHPPGGDPSAVVIADDCAAEDLAQDLTACGAVLGGNLSCVDASTPGAPHILSNAERLRFRFPDTDAVLGGADDDVTLVGPARIAVGSAPFCQELLQQGCSKPKSMTACIDKLYAQDGTCQTDELGATFSAFTALPPPNVYSAMCTDPEGEDGPCLNDDVDPPVRLTTDAAGNALIPMNWTGVIFRIEDTPFPRLVTGSTGFPTSSAPDAPAVRVPPSMIGSYAQNGVQVPPLFTPLAAEGEENAGLELFGTVDAAIGLMRIARRSQRFLECSGGSFDGLPCNEATDCPNGTCGPTTCRGGDDEGTACSSDAECSVECGPGLFDWAGLGEHDNRGPVLVTEYQAQAGNIVQIDSLIDTDDALVFPVDESVVGRSENADSDTSDSVVFVGDAKSGFGDAQSATSRVRQRPFRFAAIAAEGDIVAYAEPEPNEGDCGDAVDACDQTDDLDIADTILRALRVEGGSATPVSAVLGNVCIDAAPMIANRSLVVSDGLVFVRADEPACASHESLAYGGFDQVLDPISGVSRDGDLAVTTEGTYPFAFDIDLVSISRITFSAARLDNLPGDLDTFGVSFVPEVDAAGSRVVFVSNLPLTPDASFADDIFVHDVATGTKTLVNRDTDGSVITADDSHLYPGISRNGRYVSFGDGSRILLRDLEQGTTTVIASTSDPDVAAACAGPCTIHGSSAAPSDDGRVVVWKLRPAGDVTISRAIVTDTRTGTLYDFFSLDAAVDALGNVIAFDSNDETLVDNDTNGVSDVFVRDLRTRRIERVSVGTNGETPSVTSYLVDLSGDGRRVAFETAAPLVPNDAPLSTDVFIHDRVTGITERASVDASGQSFADPIASGFNAAGTGGRVVAFATESAGFQPRMRVFNKIDPDARYNPDQDLDSLDVVLAVLDTRVVDGELVGIGSAGQVDVAAGNAAFLQGGDVDPRGGPVGLYRNRSSEGPEDLGLFATRVEISPEWVAALVSEPVVCGDVVGDCSLNDAAGDTDREDLVVHVNAVATATADTWLNVGQAADDLDVAGPFVAFTTPEAAQNATPLNGDDLADDRVLQLFDASVGLPDGLKTFPWAVKDFVLGEFQRVCVASTADSCSEDTDCPGNDSLCHSDGTCREVSSLCSVDADCSGGETCESDLIVAFRVSEAGQDAFLNGPPNSPDTDKDDDVLFAYDVLLDKEQQSGQAVTPCEFPACDPRRPYRVVGSTIRFLTAEDDQGGQDLNNNDVGGETLVQVFSVRSKQVQPLGAVAGPPPAPEPIVVAAAALAEEEPLPEDSTPYDPLAPLQDPGPGQGASSAFVSRGLCIDPFEGAIQGTCASGDDCPGNSTCEPEVITVTSADRDDDAVPDAIDNCPDVVNPEQRDADLDGTGDLCDLQTCGNGIREFDENCDDGNLEDGDGCSRFCSAPEPPVEIDVMPGRAPDVIFLNVKGAIAVLVSGSPDVNVLDLDRSTLRFGPGEAPLLHQGGPHFGQLLGEDHLLDAMLHFDVQATGLEPGDAEACLVGELDGILFEACDEVVVIGSGLADGPPSRRPDRLGL